MAAPAPVPLFVLRGSQYPVTCVRFHCQQETSSLLSGSTAGEVKIWNLKTRRPVANIDSHGGKGILTVLSSKMRGCIMSHGRDGKLNCWTLEEGRHTVTATIPIPCQGFCGCDLLEGGDHQLIGSPGGDNSEVRVYDLSSMRVIKTLVPPRSHQPLGMPMCLKFLSTQLLGVGFEDGSIIIWDLTADRIIAERKFFTDPVMGFDFSMDLMKGVCGSVGDTVVSWTLDDGCSCIDLGVEGKITNPGISDVSVREDGRIIACGGWDSRIRIFGMKKLKPLAVLAYHTQSVQCLQFSGKLADFTDKELLAAGSKDKHISVWSIYNG